MRLSVGEANLQSGTDASQISELSVDSQFSPSEVSEEFSKFNNSALGLDGLSKISFSPSVRKQLSNELYFVCLERSLKFA